MEAESANDLARENEDLLQFVYASPVGLIQNSDSGLIEMINPIAMQLLVQIVRTPIVTNFFKIMENYAPELFNMVEAFSRPNGEICVNHHIHIEPSSGAGCEDGKVIGCTVIKLGTERLMVTIADITRQIAQERRLKQAETWFASVLNDANDFAVVSLDTEGLIDGVNASVLKQTGFNESDALGQTLEIFEANDGSSSVLRVADQISAARRNGWHLQESWHKRRDGKPYWCQTLITVRSEAKSFEGTEIAGFSVVLRDVTRQEFNAGMLRQMLTTDNLTGASNRAHFFEVAERERSRAIRYHQPLSLITLDIDHFKLVNDTYGHAGGDEALKAVSLACLNLLKPSEVFARIGGEEFVVLLPGIDLVEAAERAEQLRSSVAATCIELNGPYLHCTISLGCSTLSSQDNSVSAMLAAADVALYEAKRTGRNRVVLSDDPTAIA